MLSGASRGARMVHGAAQPSAAGGAAARTQAGAIAQAPDAEVELRPPTARVSHVPSWDTLARRQQDEDVNETRLLKAADGEVFALDDRNLLTMQWRHVFVVRDGLHFVLYDSKGDLIVEEKYGVPNGRQWVDELIEEFTTDGCLYYRPGKTRNMPLSERVHPSPPRHNASTSSTSDKRGPMMEASGIVGHMCAMT